LYLGYLSTLLAEAYQLLYPVMFFIYLSLTMSYLNTILDDAAARIGGTRSEVRASLRPATLTLADAQRYGFDTIEEYAEAIREYAANC